MIQLESGELPQIMREVADALGAVGAVLTLHPTDDSTSEILAADDEAGLNTEFVTSFVESREFRRARPSNVHAWCCSEVNSSSSYDVLLLPVARSPGHGRLIISAFFTGLTEEQRRCAEEAYLRRRPFAIGYFRLWQRERTLWRRLRALEATVNLTEIGVLLLNRSRELAFANDAANAVLDAGDGLRRNREAIAATQLRDDVRLQVAINHVIHSNAAGHVADPPGRLAPILSLRRANGLPLIISVLPTEDRAAEPGDVAAIIYILDRAIDVSHALQPVCKLYQLSPTETRLACLLTAGSTLTQAARLMQIKPETARGYVRSLFLKTDTNRQTDLVLLLLSSIMRTTRAVLPETF